MLESMEYVVETSRLTKFFGEKNVVYQLNMRVPKGGIFGFLGPNGAGKTTTIKMILNLIRPSYGRVRIFNEYDSIKDHLEICRRVGYLPEKPMAYPNMTGTRFLLYMARLCGIPRYEAKTRVIEVLRFVGLGRHSETPAVNLSAGQKQRLGLAQALLHDPELLILDEPTANLDPLGRVQLVKRLREFVRDEQKTIVLSSHILPEIERTCDYIGVISQGSLVMEGKVSEIITKVEDTDFVILTNDAPLLVSKLKEIDDVLVDFYEKEGQVFIQVHKNHISEFRQRIISLLSENKLELRSFKPVRMPIEKAFLDSIGITEGEGAFV